jgi:hypothetical protein
VSEYDRNIVAERDKMVRIMPPEIEEQEPGKTENPKNKKSKFILNK